MTATAPSLSPSPSAAVPGVNPWLVALTVSMATFMEVLDTSIANVALPHIAGNLSASVDESTWILTGYLVSNAIVLPLSGWMSNLIGRKRFYMTCVALFGISSWLCGMAPNLGMLIFFRVLQGMGGGGLQPSEQAILADTFTPAKRGMAFAMYGMAVVAAPAIGPTLGGYITDHYNWRWVFFINVPIVVLSLFMTSQFVKDPEFLEEERKRRRAKGFRIDYIGLGLVAVGLGFLQVVLDKGQEEDWFGSNFILLCSVASAVGIVGAIAWELRHPDPIVDLKLLGERNFAVANLLMYVLGFVLLGSTVLIPLFCQVMLGYTAEQAGLVISPGGVAIMLCMPFVGFLIQHVDPRKMIAFGLAVSASGLWLMGHFDLNVDFSTVMWARVAQAMGLAFLFVPINTVAYAFLPKEKNNNASGLINMARNVGGSIGISVATTMLARRAQVHQTYLSANVTASRPAARAALNGAIHAMTSQGVNIVHATEQARAMLANQMLRQAQMLAYLDVFHMMIVFFLGAIPFAFLMKRPKPGAAAMAH